MESASDEAEAIVEENGVEKKETSSISTEESPVKENVEDAASKVGDSKVNRPGSPQSILADIYGVEISPSWPSPVAPGPDPYGNYLQLFQQGVGSANVGALPILQRIREEPKNNKRPAECRPSWESFVDSTLPKELKEQFQPLFCKLCALPLGSNSNAKIHYMSKKHNKRVKKFLEEYAEKTGTPLHKRAKLSVTKIKNGTEDQDPRHFHCDLCDLPLTGKAHADSHYMGKNHQKAIGGRKAPAGKGYFDDNGKFVRMVSIPSDREGGFGEDFLPKNPDKATSLRCEICKVSVTSLPQMDMHLQGQKHKKKLKANGLAPPPQPITESPQAAMYASYRTPSGQFYCKVCDLSLNSESQFTSHLQSKNHMKKCIKGNNLWPD